jgi:hypothetical protein
MRKFFKNFQQDRESPQGRRRPEHFPAGLRGQASFKPQAVRRAIKQVCDPGEFRKMEHFLSPSLRIELHNEASHHGPRLRVRRKPRVREVRTQKAEIPCVKGFHAVADIPQSAPFQNPCQLDLRVLVPWIPKCWRFEFADGQRRRAMQRNPFQ